MKVKDVMTSPVVSVEPDSTVPAGGSDHAAAADQRAAGGRQGRAAERHGHRRRSAPARETGTERKRPALARIPVGPGRWPTNTPARTAARSAT